MNDNQSYPSASLRPCTLCNKNGKLTATNEEHFQAADEQNVKCWACGGTRWQKTPRSY